MTPLMIPIYRVHKLIYKHNFYIFSKTLITSAFTTFVAIKVNPFFYLYLHLLNLTSIEITL